jgi:hypothetical protein
MVRRLERDRKGHPVSGRRWLILVAAAAVVLSSCSNLGVELPACPDQGASLPGSILLEAQAVPTARYGPCLRQLEPGWEAHDLRARSGRAWFWIDSDRMGDRFLTVSLQKSCAPGPSAIGAESGYEGISLYRDVATPDPIATLVVVPVAERHVAYAIDLVDRMREAGLAVRGWESFGRPFSERVTGVLESGYVALIVDDVDVEAETAAIRTPQAPQDEESGTTFDQILLRFGTAAGLEVYRGEWSYVFEGGCILYEFDAEGPGSSDVVNIVDNVLGVVPLEQLREIARQDGYDI